MNEPKGPIPGYCVVDILGHQRYVGYVSEELIAGVPMLRIAVPTAENEWEVVYQSPASLYAIRPCTEELARLLAQKHPLPAFDEWDLPQELRRKLQRLEEMEREDEVPAQYPVRRGRPYLGSDFSDFEEDEELEDSPRAGQPIPGDVCCGCWDQGGNPIKVDDACWRSCHGLEEPDPDCPPMDNPIARAHARAEASAPMVAEPDDLPFN